MSVASGGYLPSREALTWPKDLKILLLGSFYIRVHFWGELLLTYLLFNFCSFTKELRDIANGDALHDSNCNVIKHPAMEETANQFPVDIGQNESEANQTDSNSPVELYKKDEVLTTNNGSEDSSEQSPVNFFSPVKPTSLDGVLKLLQDQQLIQHLGQQKFNQGNIINYIPCDQPCHG